MEKRSYIPKIITCAIAGAFFFWSYSHYFFSWFILALTIICILNMIYRMWICGPGKSETQEHKAAREQLFNSTFGTLGKKILYLPEIISFVCAILVLLLLNLGLYTTVIAWILMMVNAAALILQIYLFLWYGKNASK